MTYEELLRSLLASGAKGTVIGPEVVAAITARGPSDERAYAFAQLELRDRLLADLDAADTYVFIKLHGRGLRILPADETGPHGGRRYYGNLRDNRRIEAVVRMNAAEALPDDERRRNERLALVMSRMNQAADRARARGRVEPTSRPMRGSGE